MRLAVWMALVTSIVVAGCGSASEPATEPGLGLLVDATAPAGSECPAADALTALLGAAGVAYTSHLHLMISPPHRTETRLKYLAGSELMAGAFMTDVAPEQAAARLREAMSWTGR